MGVEESRAGSVRFGDQPNFDVVPCPIGAEDSETIPNRKFILSSVLFADFTPISCLVPFEKLKGAVIRLVQGS
jgi:hypothetical protein